MTSGTFYRYSFHLLHLLLSMTLIIALKSIKIFLYFFQVFNQKNPAKIVKLPTKEIS